MKGLLFVATLAVIVLSVEGRRFALHPQVVAARAAAIQQAHHARIVRHQQAHHARIVAHQQAVHSAHQVAASWYQSCLYRVGEPTGVAFWAGLILKKGHAAAWSVFVPAAQEELVARGLSPALAGFCKGAVKKPCNQGNIHLSNTRACNGGHAYRCEINGDPHLHVWNHRHYTRGEAQNIGINWIARLHTGHRMLEVQALFTHVTGFGKTTAVSGVAIRLANGFIFHTNHHALYYGCKQITAAQASTLPGVSVVGNTVTVYIDHIRVRWGLGKWQWLDINGRQCDFMQAHGWCSVGYNAAFFSQNWNGFAEYNPACVDDSMNLFLCAGQPAVEPTRAPLVKHIPKVCSEKTKAEASAKCTAVFHGFDTARCQVASFIKDCVVDFCNVEEASRPLAIRRAFEAWKREHSGKHCHVTQAPETQAPETQAPETQAPETQAPETQAPETQAPETQAPTTHNKVRPTRPTRPVTQAPVTQAPETQAPETQAPETQAPVTVGQETQEQAPLKLGSKTAQAQEEQDQ